METITKKELLSLIEELIYDGENISYNLEKKVNTDKLTDDVHAALLKHFK